MKRFLSVLLCALMIVSLFAGCGEEKDPTTTAAHKHTYSTQWTTDENSHWYAATCEHTNLQANYGEHLDENKDSACDICGYEDTTCAHTYSDAWSSDETSHWHAATCEHYGAVSEKADHSDADNDGACDTCGYNGGHTHTYADEWITDEAGHYHAATCGHDVKGQQGSHADIDLDGACDTCGWADPAHTHSFQEAWSQDVTYHWYAATCQHIGAVSEKGEHADSDENGKCDTCGYLMCHHTDFDLDGECDICGWSDPTHTHTYGDMASATAGHWQVADCHPGATSEVQSHSDGNKDGKCDVCGFQTCGHSYEAIWSTDDTYHWHAVTCTCSIPRKDYAQHVDANDDGECDVCMYGAKVPAVYEVILSGEPVAMTASGIINWLPFEVNFPQAGTYVITPNNENVRVWTSNDICGNTGSTLTLEVEEAGKRTLYFYYADINWKSSYTLKFLYSVTRADDLVLTTMKGKAELPTNMIYRIVVESPELGTYKLITGVDGLVIGLSEASMEYYKGHIEFTVTDSDDEVIELYVALWDNTQQSFTFDWILEEPFHMDVSTGDYAIDVDPKSINYKVIFTAPEDGYFKLSVASEWLTFCQWSDDYNQPVRMEIGEVLTPEMKAGETYTIWLQAVYDYPAASNIYDTLTVANVGQKLEAGDTTVKPGSEGSKFCFQATESTYYNISASGGQIGVIAANGTVTWTDSYEVNMGIHTIVSFMVRGSGNVSVSIHAVDYTMTLVGTEEEYHTNTITMVPSRDYNVVWHYLTDEEGHTSEMMGGSKICLTWDHAGVSVYVNGEPYEAGTEIMLQNNTFTISVKNNGNAEVNFNVRITHLSTGSMGGDVTTSTSVDLSLNLTEILSLPQGSGAYANYVAEYGGTYYFHCYSENALVYLAEANGQQTFLFSGAGSYTLQLDVGEVVSFYVVTADYSAAEVSVQISSMG